MDAQNEGKTNNEGRLFAQTEKRKLTNRPAPPKWMDITMEKTQNMEKHHQTSDNRTGSIDWHRPDQQKWNHKLKNEDNLNKE